MAATGSIPVFPVMRRYIDMRTNPLRVCTLRVALRVFVLSTATIGVLWVSFFLWVFGIGVLLPDDTIYGRRFSTAQFSKIQPGMSHDDVIRLIGEPLEVWSISRSNGERTVRKHSWDAIALPEQNLEQEWWFYSKPGRFNYRWYYRVTMGAKRRVTRPVSARVE
jgi:hypothetical protein